MLTGAAVATLLAFAAHYLGVQDLIRIPDLALFLPAAVAGAIVGPTRLRVLLWLGVFAVASIVIVITYTPVVSVLAGPLVRRDPLPARLDAIAALSQGLTPDGRMRSASLDRLLSGLALAREGRANVVLVSVEQRTYGGKPVSDSADRRAIVTAFGTSAEILFVDSVFSTRTEALRMRQLAWPRGWRQIAVVTSPLHTRRACATFEAVGFRVVCVPAASREHVVPDADGPRDRLRTFRSWLYETFASATYRSRGWIR